MPTKKVINTKKTVAKTNKLDNIIVKGARMHNLKNITVAFPKNKFIVVTGVSGSGKSSLTMDTLFAEGQRRYAESLSSYARQFLMRLDKPDVDYIEGICPAVAIEQKVSSRSPRSTVGSMTELLDYLRLLFARIGITYSPVSGQIVKKDEVVDVVNYIADLKNEARVYLCIPFPNNDHKTTEDELKIILQKGFTRCVQFDKNGIQLLHIEDILDNKDLLNTDHLYVLIDRILAEKSYEEEVLHRLADSINVAFYENYGACTLIIDTKKEVQTIVFNNKFEADGLNFEEPNPNFFSFNNPYGACPHCEGYGSILGIDKNLIIPNKTKSIYEDAVVCWNGEKMGEWKQHFIREEGSKGFPIHKPIIELNEIQLKIVHNWIDSFFKMVEEQSYKIQYRVMMARYRGKTTCPTCHGGRLRADALFVKVGGKDIITLSNMPISQLKHWFDELVLNDHQAKIAQRILIEIKQRINTLEEVGLKYLTLYRQANTLSGGESQRINLTKFLGSNLTDSLYILDEPSIGLHPRDTNRLINVLHNLRDLNNTVIVVEHDELMMEKADHIIDMGPLAAHLGGEVIAEGPYESILNNNNSLTGMYLSGKLQVSVDNFIPLPQNPYFITITGCHQHNLKNIDVSIPLHTLCVVTGVSGSGKTTLIKNTLYPAIQRHLGQTAEFVGAYNSLSGDLHKIQQVELIDQNPIGKSSRSNPATYLKLYDDIRSLMAAQKSAKLKGFEAKHFSFNVDGGRCDTCKGEGEVVVSMQFLADVYLTCETCKGKKFKEEVLAVTYQQKNIYDILTLSVDEAIDFFKDHKTLVQKLDALSQTGLGYIKLGQSSNTLSGGEAQRVKLAYYLSKGKSKEQILFIFDEPTTGLHFNDINKLLHAFYALIANGHSLIVIEHNTAVIKHANWLIDIGPEGGNEGGRLLYAGPTAGIQSASESITKQYI